MSYVHVLGPVKGNQQSITIMEKYGSTGQTIVTTPEKVDEYIAANKAAQSKDNRRALGFFGGGSVVGAALGAIYNSVKKQKDLAMLSIIGACFGFAGGGVAALFGKSAEQKVAEEFIANNK